jgi:hypothetical protein
MNESKFSLLCIHTLTLTFSFAPSYFIFFDRNIEFQEFTNGFYKALPMSNCLPSGSVFYSYLEIAKAKVQQKAPFSKS